MTIDWTGFFDEANVYFHARVSINGVTYLMGRRVCNKIIISVGAYDPDLRMKHHWGREATEEEIRLFETEEARFNKWLAANEPNPDYT